MGVTRVERIVVRYSCGRHDHLTEQAATHCLDRWLAQTAASARHRARFGSVEERRARAQRILLAVAKGEPLHIIAAREGCSQARVCDIVRKCVVAARYHFPLDIRTPPDRDEPDVEHVQAHADYYCQLVRAYKGTFPPIQH